MVGQNRPARSHGLAAAYARGLLLAAVFGCAGKEDCPMDLPDDSDCASATPSYARQVSGVMEQYCEVCHLPGNGRSSTLLTNYDQIYSERRTAFTQIYNCEMPTGHRQLTAENRALLLKWFVCGAPNN
jgi:hypothetical protein